MLVDKKMSVSLSTKTYKHYLEKGYDVYTNGKFINGTKIEINSYDIKPTSREKVECICDKCGSIMIRFPYNRNFETNVDICSKCKNIDSNLQKKTLLIDEVKDELDKYIQLYGTVAGFCSKNKIGYRIKHYNLDIKELCEQLGYNWFLVGKNRNSHNFKNKEELFEFINKIIDVIGYFPTSTQLNSFGVWHRTYSKFFKSYADLRSEYGYVDIFVDKIGYKCRSSYELMFANYLIDNNILFTREEKLFNNKQYRSDFTLYKTNGEKTHIEIWGLLKDKPVGDIEILYKNSYFKKMELYTKNNISLISFYSQDFKTKSNMIKAFNKQIDLKIFQKCSYEIIGNNIETTIFDDIKNKFGLTYIPTINDYRNNKMNKVISYIYTNYCSVFEFNEVYKSYLSNLLDEGGGGTIWQKQELV